MKHRIIIAGLQAVLIAACGGGKGQGSDTTAANASDLSGGTVSDGEMMVEQGDYAGAAALFETIVKKTPSEPKAHYYLALSMSKLGDLDGAVSHYEKAIAIDDKRVLKKNAVLCKGIDVRCF